MYNMHKQQQKLRATSMQKPPYLTTLYCVQPSKSPIDA